MRTNTNRAARLIIAAEQHREKHHEGGACDMPSGSPRYGTLHCPAPGLYDEAAALLPPIVSANPVSEEEDHALKYIPTQPWSPEIKNYRDYRKAQQLAARFRNFL